MCGWQVKLCDLNVTHGTYLSALNLPFSLLYAARTNWNYADGLNFVI